MLITLHLWVRLKEKCLPLVTLAKKLTSKKVCFLTLLQKWLDLIKDRTAQKFEIWNTFFFFILGICTMLFLA